MNYNKKTFYIFTGPILIAFFMVVLIPLIIGVYYSFTEWNGRMDQIPNFIGFKNYIDIIKDEGFRKAFFFTAKFTIVSVIVINTIGFGLALLVTKKLKISNFMRTIFFMPNLIGGLILGFIWQFIFMGVFQYISEITGWTFFAGWLSNANTGFWGLVIIMTWQMSGYLMIIYIAALQNIPKSLIEAAEIDGASGWAKTRHIIFPMVAPAFTISMFLTLANSFKLFDQNLSLTNGGPGGATEMLALNIYKTAYTFTNYGEAQAKAVVFFLLVAAITMVQVYTNKKKEVEM
ncbi:MAG: sugar ABC transporter permease [Fusobacteria bacterium]|nr:MAG: sugar ABC transporter permease [Fusobacteriota bacterium]